MAEKLGMPSSTISNALGNGGPITASGPLSLELQCGAFRDSVELCVMKLPEQYDVILGNA